MPQLIFQLFIYAFAIIGALFVIFTILVLALDATVARAQAGAHVIGLGYRRDAG